MRNVLIDAGPMVALLHKGDQDHEACLEAFKTIRNPLFTTLAAMTEAMYLLDFSRKAQDALLDMVERKAITLAPIGFEDVPRIRALMRRYADLPMDCADASLVRIAHREGLSRMFTLDRRDFSVYLGPKGKHFSLLP